MKLSKPCDEPGKSGWDRTLLRAARASGTNTTGLGSRSGAQRLGESDIVTAGAAVRPMRAGTHQSPSRWAVPSVAIRIEWVEFVV